MCLCGILDDLEIVLVCPEVDVVHSTDIAVKMNGKHRPSALGEERLHAFDIDEIVAQGGFAKNGLEACLTDGKDGGNEGVGRDDDLVAVGPAKQHFVGAEDECERIKSVAYENAMASAAVFGELLLEESVLFALKIPTAAQYFFDGLRDLRLETIVDFLEIEELDYSLVGIGLNASHVVDALAVEVDVVPFVAHCPAAEALLLEDESLVEPTASPLGGNAEVEVFHLLETLSDEVAEEEVESAKLASLVVGGNVLDVGNLLGDKDHTTGCQALLVANDKRPNLARKALHEQSHLLFGVDGIDTVVFLKHLSEQLPEFVQCLSVALVESLDVEIVVECLLGLTLAQGAHAKLIAHGNDRTDAAGYLASADAEEGVEVLVGGVGAIDVGKRLVDEFLGLQHVAIVLEHLLHDEKHLLLCDIDTDNEAAIGESLMGIDGALRLHPVGWKNSLEAVAAHGSMCFATVGIHIIDQHGAVEKTVGMIVHETALDEESGIF